MTPSRSLRRRRAGTSTDLKWRLRRPSLPLLAEAATEGTEEPTDVDAEPATRAADLAGDAFAGPTANDPISTATETPSAPMVGGLFASVILLAVLGGLAAWTGHSALQASDSDRRHAAYVDAAREGALDLANIDAAQVDTDVQRILESSTGNFRQQFEQRSRGFTDFVQKAHSTSQATIRDAGLESEDGNRARVLVALSVKVSSAATTPDQPLRSWRLRVTVERIQDGSIKVSDVEFVP